MINIKIKTYNKDHIDLVNAIEKMCFKHPQSLKELSQFKGWVAYCDDEIIGYVLYKDLDEQNIFIESLAVHPFHRNNGCGTNLMKEITKFCDKNNKRSHLFIKIEHKSLINFYNKFNYILKCKQTKECSCALFRKPLQ